MKIAKERPGAADVAALLALHLDEARQHSPPGTVHALPLDGLQAPSVTFWTARGREGQLFGFGALKRLNATDGEIKSMRTAPGHLKKGVGAAILQAIIAEARTQDLRALYLETGNTAHFHAAHRLYQRHGFNWCDAFADYPSIAFSKFMRLDL